MVHNFKYRKRPGDINKMITDEGLNRIRDMVSADITSMELGTGTTAVTAADTDLETADANSIKTITKLSTDKQIKFDYTLNSTEGSTGTYTEMKLYGSTSDFDRVVFEGIDWTASGSENLFVTKRYFFKQV
jgi:hypothetical protein